MSGTLGIIANDTGRYTLFSVAITQLQHPPNTSIDWGISTDLALARNKLVERSLKIGSEWMYFLDDDHVVPADGLMRLLKHDKDIVCSLYLRRAQPFSPVAFSQRNEEGSYDTIDLRTTPTTGLIPVYAAGTAGMLIKSEVFRAIPYPWFESGHVGDWNASEDIIFCEKAREAGFEIFLDVEAKLGHMAPTAIWPSVSDEDDQWIIGFTVADGCRLYTHVM